MDKELIKKNIKLMDATIEKMIHVMSSIHKLQLSVKELEDSN